MELKYQDINKIAQTWYTSWTENDREFSNCLNKNRFTENEGLLYAEFEVISDYVLQTEGLVVGEKGKKPKAYEFPREYLAKKHNTTEENIETIIEKVNKATSWTKKTILKIICEQTYSDNSDQKVLISTIVEEAKKQKIDEENCMHYVNEFLEIGLFKQPEEGYLQEGD